MKKFIIILFTSLAFSQASNQMVSFNDAQSLGFALNAGQSHLSSNKCMTKLDALTKYNLNASSMTGYTDNQLVPRSVWTSAVPYFTYVVSQGEVEGTPATCTSYDTHTIEVYSSQTSIAIPMTFYYNTALTLPASLNSDIYYQAENKILSINNVGELTAITGCTTTYYSYTFTYSSAPDGPFSCSLIDYGLTLYSPSSILGVGTELYTSSSLTTRYNGSDRFRLCLEAVDSAFQIGTDGVVTELHYCF